MKKRGILIPRYSFDQRPFYPDDPEIIATAAYIYYLSCHLSRLEAAPASPNEKTMERRAREIARTKAEIAETWRGPKGQALQAWNKNEQTPTAMTQEERTAQALERIADALELIAGIAEDDTRQAPISRLADPVIMKPEKL